MLDGPLGGERGNSPFETKMNEKGCFRDMGLEVLFVCIFRRRRIALHCEWRPLVSIYSFA